MKKMRKHSGPLCKKLEYKKRKLGFEEKAFFEYHIYTLGRKSTIKENQTKQISLLEASDIPIKKNLIFYGAEYYYRNQLWRTDFQSESWSLY